MSRREMIREMLASAPGKCANGTGWGERHVTAWREDRKARPIRLLVEALAELADEHARNNDGMDIKDDGYSGEYFESIGEATIKLLSAQVSPGLDAGLVDALIRRMGATETD